MAWTALIQFNFLRTGFKLSNKVQVVTNWKEKKDRLILSLEDSGGKKMMLKNK